MNFLCGSAESQKRCLKRVDLPDNPVGYRTSFGKMLRILLFLSLKIRSFARPKA
jgi:hypothetical protein